MPPAGRSAPVPHRLREQGYTLGAAAAAFSISYQRAQQLAAEAGGGGSRIAS